MKTVIRLPLKESTQPTQPTQTKFKVCAGCEAPEHCRDRGKCAKS